MKRVFKISLEGQYMGSGDASGVSIIKAYKADFLLTSLEAALSNIVRHLLEAKLRSMYPDYRTYRTHKIVKVEIVEGPPPDRSVLQKDLEGMDLSELADFCILREIQVDPFKCEPKTIKVNDEKVKMSQLDVARELIIKKWQEKRNQARDDEKDKLARTDQEDLLALNNLKRDDAPVKLVMGGRPPVAAAVSTEAHTPGAPVVQPVKDPVEPSSAPLPEPEIDAPITVSDIE